MTDHLVEMGHVLKKHGYIQTVPGAHHPTVHSYELGDHAVHIGHTGKWRSHITEFGPNYAHHDDSYGNDKNDLDQHLLKFHQKEYLPHGFPENYDLHDEANRHIASDHHEEHGNHDIAAILRAPIGGKSEHLNSSGQGFHRGHRDHVNHADLVAHGYQYSHTTPIHRVGGTSLWHTYKRGDHNIAVEHNSLGLRWNASKSGSGYHHQSTGQHSLRKYLKYKTSQKPSQHAELNDPRECSSNQQIKDTLEAHGYKHKSAFYPFHSYAHPDTHHTITVNTLTHPMVYKWNESSSEPGYDVHHGKHGLSHHALHDQLISVHKKTYTPHGFPPDYDFSDPHNRGIAADAHEEQGNHNAAKALRHGLDSQYAEEPPKHPLHAAFDAVPIGGAFHINWPPHSGISTGTTSGPWVKTDKERYAHDGNHIHHKDGSKTRFPGSTVHHVLHLTGAYVNHNDGPTIKRHYPAKLIPKGFPKNYDLHDESNRMIAADHLEEHGNHHAANELRGIDAPNERSELSPKGASGTSQYAEHINPEYRDILRRHGYHPAGSKNNAQRVDGMRVYQHPSGHQVYFKGHNKAYVIGTNFASTIPYNAWYSYVPRGKGIPGTTVHSSHTSGETLDKHLYRHHHENLIPSTFPKDYDLKDAANRGVLADHHEEHGNANAAHVLRNWQDPVHELHSMKQYHAPAQYAEKEPTHHDVLSDHGWYKFYSSPSHGNTTHSGGYHSYAHSGNRAPSWADHAGIIQVHNNGQWYHIRGGHSRETARHGHPGRGHDAATLNNFLVQAHHKDYIPQGFPKDYDLTDHANRGIAADHHEEHGNEKHARILRYGLDSQHDEEGVYIQHPYHELLTKHGFRHNNTVVTSFVGSGNYHTHHANRQVAADHYEEHGNHAIAKILREHVPHGATTQHSERPAMTAKRANELVLQTTKGF